MEKNLHVVVSASVERFRQQMEAAGKGAAGFRDKMVAASSVISEQKQILIEFESELIKLQDKLKNTSSTNITAQKALKSEIQRLNIAIKEQKLAVRELSQEKTNMSTSLQEVRGKAEANTQAMEAMTRAVNAASMAVLLLGDDNKELQPLVKAAQVTMALFGATIAVANLFIRENNVVLQAQIGLQKAFAAVVGTSTGMLKAFKIALASTGVLLAVVAIGYLIEKLITMGDELDNLQESLKGVNDAYDEFSSSVDSEIRDLERSTKLLVAKAKLAKKSEKEIYAIQKSGNEAKKRLLEKKITENGNAYLKESLMIQNAENSNTKITEEALANLEDLKKKGLVLTEEYNSLKNDLEVDDINFQAEKNDRSAKEQQKALDDAKKAADKARADKSKALQSEMNLLIAEENEKKANALQTATTAKQKTQIENQAAQTIIGIKEEFTRLLYKNQSQEEKDTVAFNTAMLNLNTERTNNQIEFADNMNENNQKEIDDAEKAQKEKEHLQEESFKREITAIKERYDAERTLAAQTFAMNKNKSQYDQAINEILIKELEELKWAYLEAEKSVTELDLAIAKAKAGITGAATETTDIANRMARAVGQAFSKLASDMVNVLGEGLSRYFEGTSEEAKIAIDLLKIRQAELSKTMKDAEATDEERLRARLEYLKGEEDLLNMQQSNLQQTFNGILSVVADFMDTLGKALIATAIASEAFRDSIALNPAAAIVAGAALVGLAAITRSHLEKGPKFAKGGIAYGEVNNATFGEYSGVRTNPEVVAPLNTLKSLLGIDRKGMGGTEIVYGETFIKGSDLAIVLKKANVNLSRG